MDTCSRCGCRVKKLYKLVFQYEVSEMMGYNGTTAICKHCANELFNVVKSELKKYASDAKGDK